jgi:hypothetical protein
VAVPFCPSQIPHDIPETEPWPSVSSPWFSCSGKGQIGLLTQGHFSIWQFGWGPRFSCMWDSSYFYSPYLMKVLEMSFRTQTCCTLHIQVLSVKRPDRKCLATGVGWNNILLQSPQEATKARLCPHYEVHERYVVIYLLWTIKLYCVLGFLVVFLEL